MFDYTGSKILEAIRKTINSYQESIKEINKEKEKIILKKKRLLEEYKLLPFWKKIFATKPSLENFKNLYSSINSAIVQMNFEIRDLKDVEKLINPENVYFLTLDECRKYGILSKKKVENDDDEILPVE